MWARCRVVYQFSVLWSSYKYPFDGSSAFVSFLFLSYRLVPYAYRVFFPLRFSASKDTFFGEYFIPKGTVVMANIRGVHMDPNIWKNPETFDPARFLKEDGVTLRGKPEHLLTFSVGTSIWLCIGISMELRNSPVAPTPPFSTFHAFHPGRTHSKTTWNEVQESPPPPLFAYPASFNYLIR